jgi:hypothetical protein
MRCLGLPVVATWRVVAKWHVVNAVSIDSPVLVAGSSIGDQRMRERLRTSGLKVSIILCTLN